LNAARRSGLSRVGTTAVIENPRTFYANLNQIRLLKVAGGNPQLAFKTGSSPFAEVLPNRGKIRMIESGKEFIIKKNIFSVQGNGVNIRSGALIENNVIGKVSSQDLVVVLGEQNGWYQVQVLQAGVVTTGYIYSALLAPLILAGNNDDDFSGIKHYKTCNDCVGKGMVNSTVDCANCNRGEISCFNCKGSGNLFCNRCKGVGYWKCSNCKGTKQKTCYSCNGQGRKSCYPCRSQGLIDCMPCRGYGFVIVNGNFRKRCNSCSGRGKFICRKCHGTKFTSCIKCHGFGSQKCLKCTNSGNINCTVCNSVGSKACFKCNQTGKMNCIGCFGQGFKKSSHECPTCYGYGKIEID